VPGEQSPREADVNEVSDRLSEGLKTCRAVVATYKSLLTADQRPSTDEPGPGEEAADGISAGE
jgi:hypothetical protein